MHIHKLVAESLRFAGPSPLEARWEYLGPRDLPPGAQEGNGPGALAGRVNAVAFDPLRAGTYYAGAASGGLWRTTDAGANWTCLTDDWPPLNIGSVTVHPHDGRILYVGTGDFPMSHTTRPDLRDYSIGLLRTTDGGATWMQLGGEGFVGTDVSRVVVDPDDSRIVLMTTGRGRAGIPGRVWRSTDGGETWTAVIPQAADWCDLKYGARARNGARWYYAAGLGEPRQLWRSGDRGATWTRLNPGFYTGAPAYGVAVAPGTAPAGTTPPGSVSRDSSGAPRTAARRGPD